MQLKRLLKSKFFVGIINKQECPPETTRIKEENRLENSKRKLKRAALEWDDLYMQAELKSFMYVDRSLLTKKEKLIDELNSKKCMQLKRLLKSKFFVGIKNKQRKYIIHPDFMVANQEITDQFIQNIKSNPKKVHDLTGEMKKSFKKQRLETNILPQIHKISRITDSYGITT